MLVSDQSRLRNDHFLDRLADFNCDTNQLAVDQGAGS